MRYGRIFDYRNRHEAKIGRRYLFADVLEYLVDPEEKMHDFGELSRISADPYPFCKDGYSHFQFIREVIEEPALMTHRQLSEWLAKGNGQMRSAGALLYSLLVYEPKNEHDAVGKNIRIRRWDSDEWVVPTVDIYERDCR